MNKWILSIFWCGSYADVKRLVGGSYGRDGLRGDEGVRFPLVVERGAGEFHFAREIDAPVAVQVVVPARVPHSCNACPYYVNIHYYFIPFHLIFIIIIFDFDLFWFFYILLVDFIFYCFSLILWFDSIFYCFYYFILLLFFIIFYFYFFFSWLNFLLFLIDFMIFLFVIYLFDYFIQFFIVFIH